MRMLVDECAPSELARFLSRNHHQCSTVQEAGWCGKQNGEMLDLAEPKFEVFVTLDTDLWHQQNLSNRKIAIVLLNAKSNRLSDLAPLFSPCADPLKRVQPGEFLVLRSEK